MLTGEKIGVVSFIAMYMVVLIHSTVAGGGDRYEGVVINCLTRWAVPWFFFVSGSFLRKSMDRYAVQDLLRRKTKSLLIPYVLWLLLSMPVGGNADLWYLRSLTCFTMLVCFLRACGLKPANLGLSVLFSGVAVAAICLGVPWYYGTPTSPFYFLGGFVLSGWFLSDWHRPRVWVVMSFVVLAVLSRVVWAMVSLPPIGEMFVRNICIVLEGASVWLVVNCLPPRFIPHWPCLKVCFFIYCFHHHFVADWMKSLWSFIPTGLPMSGLVGLVVVSILAMTVLSWYCADVAEVFAEGLWPVVWRAVKR